MDWGGGPMDPRHNSFIYHFFSSMFKKLRPLCKFLFFGLFSFILGYFSWNVLCWGKEGVGIHLTHPPPPRLPPTIAVYGCGFWKTKKFQIFFDLTYGYYKIILCQSILRDKISFFRFATSFQFDDNCNVSK